MIAASASATRHGEEAESQRPYARRDQASPPTSATPRLSHTGPADNAEDRDSIRVAPAQGGEEMSTEARPGLAMIVVMPRSRVGNSRRENAALDVLGGPIPG